LTMQNVVGIANIKLSLIPTFFDAYHPWKQ